MGTRWIDLSNADAVKLDSNQVHLCITFDPATFSRYEMLRSIGESLDWMRDGSDTTLGEVEIEVLGPDE